MGYKLIVNLFREEEHLGFVEVTFNSPLLDPLSLADFQAIADCGQMAAGEYDPVVGAVFNFYWDRYRQVRAERAPKD